MRTAFWVVATAALLAAPAIAQNAPLGPQELVPADESGVGGSDAGTTTAPAAPAQTGTTAATTAAPTAEAEVQESPSATYNMQEIVTAADGAFGDASEAVAQVVEKIFADLGEPNAYIVGREGGGALVFGLRYGKGILFSKIEGERTVYWTGPSIGFDVGGDASRSFTLVYNLYDTEELFQRFPAVEGKAYLIGGVSANYHQNGRIILVPIRLGVGWRLGANVGYVKYSREGRILPF